MPARTEWCRGGWGGLAGSIQGEGPGEAEGGQISRTSSQESLSGCEWQQPFPSEQLSSGTEILGGQWGAYGLCPCTEVNPALRLPCPLLRDLNSPFGHWERHDKVVEKVIRKVDLGKETKFCSRVGGWAAQPVLGVQWDRAGGACGMHSWRSPTHLQQHLPRGSMLTKALAAVQEGKDSSWPSDRRGRCQGHNRDTHNGSSLCWSPCPLLWSPPNRNCSHLFEEKNPFGSWLIKKNHISPCQVPRGTGPEVQRWQHGIPNSTWIFRSVFWTRGDEAEPAGFSDMLPPTCQRASCRGSIRGCPCKGRVFGCTEASPNNPGAEEQDSWLSWCECSHFPWLLLTPSIPGCRLLENQPASPFRASGCFLSRQLWAVACRACCFLFGFAKFCFFSAGTVDRAWCSVLLAGLSCRPAGLWVAAHLPGECGVSRVGRGGRRRGGRARCWLFL